MGFQNNNKKIEYAGISLLASKISCCNTVFQPLDSFEGQDFSDPKPIAENQGSEEWRVDAE